MSNIERIENLKQIVQLVEPDFNRLAQIHGAVNFARETSFALQVLKDSPYLAEAAMNDPDSLRRAVLNVAAIGLTLSPVYKLAYLLPRKKKVCLEISYRGFVQLATDIGAIKWAHAEVVCQNDKFELRGFGREPNHSFSPFGDRGEVIGAYCVAKTFDGDFLTTVMSADEIKSIRERSESFKSGANSPWHTDRNEMIKKTVIRRAYKSWPMTDGRKRFDEAVDVTNDFDPESSPEALPPAKNARVESIAKIRELLAGLERSEEKFIEHLTRANNRDIKRLDDLTDLEMNQAITMLSAFAASKSKKETA